MWSAELQYYLMPSAIAVHIPAPRCRRNADRAVGAALPQECAHRSGIGLALSSKLADTETMGIRRRTDEMRAAPPIRGAAQTPRATGVVDRWKEQLAAGRDLEGTGEPSTNDQSNDRSPSGEPHGRDRSAGQGLSDVG